jgi:hypothetical protein
MDILLREFDRPSPAIVEEVRVESRWGDQRCATVSAVPCAQLETVGPFVAVKSGIRPYLYARVGALTTARVFRDCSLRKQSSLPERRACRTLMRQAALKWRHGLAMGY